MLDFIRIGCAVPKLQVGNVSKNVEDICRKLCEADEQGCDVLVFPEMALSGYTCADLFFQDALVKACMGGLNAILACSAQHPQVTAVVGTPARIGGQMYNCGAVISGGNSGDWCPRPSCPIMMNSMSAAGSPLPRI